jgi:hypothetical protein
MASSSEFIRPECSMCRPRAARPQKRPGWGGLGPAPTRGGGAAAAEAAVFVLVGDRTSGWPETPGVNAMSPCAWPVLSSPRLAGINLSPELVSSLRLNCYYYCTYTFLTLWFLHGQPREHMAMARVRPSVTQQFLGC